MTGHLVLILGTASALYGALTGSESISWIGAALSVAAAVWSEVREHKRLEREDRHMRVYVAHVIAIRNDLHYFLARPEPRPADPKPDLPDSPDLSDLIGFPSEPPDDHQEPTPDAPRSYPDESPYIDD